MPERSIELEQDGPVAWVWMNRPAVHNALNQAMIEELTETFTALGVDSTVRVIVLSGRGKSFSAGADVEYMKQQGAASGVSNLAGARTLAEMFRVIATSTKPTIARVNGAAMGGGLGLVAACDIALASNLAFFAASEVRLGLIPSTIAPYVVRAIGGRHARRLFQTGERISAADAAKNGLVQESVDFEQLDVRLHAMINDLLLGAPAAQSAAKSLIDAVAGRPITEDLIEDTAVRIASVRSEPEAHEGLSAFLEKRPASWVPSK
ncbi:MAG TPA: enoyl-CoA hydratase-related protein [Terracidiphilus sp.]|jgi:methylglutaconyl-CoA hydratase